MRLVIENLPNDVAEKLRRRAAEDGVSLEDAAIRLLRGAVRPRAPDAPGPPKRDLSRFFGVRPPDPDLDRAIEEMNRAPDETDAQ